MHLSMTPILSTPNFKKYVGLRARLHIHAHAISIKGGTDKRLRWSEARWSPHSTTMYWHTNVFTQHCQRLFVHNSTCHSLTFLPTNLIVVAELGIVEAYWKLRSKDTWHVNRHANPYHWFNLKFNHTQKNMKEEATTSLHKVCPSHSFMQMATHMFET